MENGGDTTPISKDELLRELRRIDAYDYDLSRDMDSVLSREKEEFFNNIHSRPSLFHQIRGFAFISGALILVFSGAFFVNKGFLAKDDGAQKSALAYESFRDAERALKEMDFGGASESFAIAYENLVSAEESIDEIGSLTVSIAENIPFSSKAESSISLLRGAKHIAKAGEIISSAFAASPFNQAMSAESFLGMLSGNDGEEEKSIYDFSDFEKNLVLAANSLAAAEEAMRNVDPLDFPEDFRENIQELGQKIPVLLDITSNAQEYSSAIKSVLGIDSPKRYLIVFQNSSELRPSGGFIGSYAIIGVSQGELKEMFVDGIYNADGQITVNVVPPEPLQHIATAWSTHDANWFLDFPTSAQKIKWFYEKTGGGTVDGVLALNVEVVEQLLAITGPISIPEYDLTLDAQSFRDEIQYEVEVAYDKNLNRPKKVLADFTPLFISKLFEVSKTKNKEIISVLLELLKEKYIIFYFEDNSVQKFFEEQGWTGSIATRDKGQETGDYLAVVHSNIGGHKTDKFMQDKVVYSVEIREDGLIVGHLSVERHHSGGSTPYWWYNRENKDYIKIYVPAGSELLSHSGGKRREPAGQADYDALGFMEDEDIATMKGSLQKSGSIDIFSESGKIVFGTWLITQPKETLRLEISYRLPFSLSFKNGIGKYNLYMQKQPGTNSAVEFSIKAPVSWGVVWDNMESGGTNGSSVSRDTKSFTLNTDKIIGYIFKK